MLLVSMSHWLVLILLFVFLANMELMLSAFSLACKLPAIACLQNTCTRRSAKYLQVYGSASTCNSPAVTGNCRCVSYLGGVGGDSVASRTAVL